MSQNFTHNNKYWPVNWRETPPEENQKLKSMLITFRDEMSHKLYCVTESLKLSSKVAKEERSRADKAIEALKIIAEYAEENNDHHLHVMAIRGLT